MHDLNDLVVFSTVVDHGGFTAAALALGLPKSSVSRRVNQLEARLGVRLLERSTRSVRPTDIGRNFHAHCRTILAQIETAESEVSRSLAEPGGIVRLGCIPGVAQFSLGYLLPDFMKQYPKVRIQVVSTDRPIHLLEDNIDLAIRAAAQPRDESLVMRRLGESRLVFVANAQVAAQARDLAHPADIATLPFLSMREDADRQAWPISNEAGESHLLRVEPVLWTREPRILLQAAEAGVGVALLPDAVVAEFLRSGRLQHVLPGWSSETVNIHLVFASRRGLSPAVRALVEFLAQRFDAREARIAP